MEVYMTHCKRRAVCQHCTKDTDKYIEVGESMVVGLAKISSQGWTKKIRWHPKCWLEQGEVYLEQHPPLPSRAGRKPLAMSVEDKKARLRLLMRHASIVQRMRELKIEEGFTEKKVSRIIVLGKGLEDITEEIKKYGGAPKSW